MKVLLAHPGTQHSYKLAELLYKRGLLLEFWTGLCFAYDSKLLYIIKLFFPSLYAKIKSRVIEIPSSFLRSQSIIDYYFFVISKFSINAEFALFKRNLLFQNLVSKKSIKKVDIVIGFDTSSLILIKKSNALNKKFILDSSIAHPKEKEEIMKNVNSMYPIWNSVFNSKSKILIESEHSEYVLASNVVVASSFTLNSLVKNGITHEKIFINPYGVDSAKFTPYKSQNEEIQFIFVGTIGVRKGIPTLVKVWESINKKDAKLRLIGYLSEDIKNLIHDSSIEIVGHVSRDEVKKLMQKSDVFVFPSFFEGFGLVLLEALSCGLPLISTTNTAASDLISEGEEGFIIEPGDEQALTEKMQYFIDNPHVIPQMSQKARAKAEQFTWDAYGDRWEKIIKEVTSC